MNSEEAATLRFHFGVIVLAAGRSTRMGDKNKLLQPYQGQSIISWVVATAKLVCPQVFVVTGHQSAQIKSELTNHAVTFVSNLDYASGLSSSLAAGITALPPEIDAAIICLGDMPRTKAEHLKNLMDAYDPQHDHSICLPVFSGKRGNPVLWGHKYFSELTHLKGDKGARDLLNEYHDQVLEVQMDDNSIHFDIDTPAELDYSKV
ncbi:NTP transferase domain-containing protein [Pseudomonadota bacterium]